MDSITYGGGRDMVERIKDRAHAPVSPSLKLNSKNLRDNFRSISSGTNVNERAVKGDDQSENSARAQPREQVNEVVKNLNDAVSFSSLALRSVEEITVERASKQPRQVQEFARDLNKLREDIESVLQVLREKAAAAEVLDENLQSSDSKLADVDTAQAHAADTGARIHFDEEKAISAHANLSAGNVAELLRE